MKRLDKIAKAKGKELTVREGGEHTRVRIGDWVDAVPRHREVKELLAKSIIKGAEKWG